MNSRDVAGPGAPARRPSRPRALVALMVLAPIVIPAALFLREKAIPRAPDAREAPPAVGIVASAPGPPRPGPARGVDWAPLGRIVRDGLAIELLADPASGPGPGGEPEAPPLDLADDGSGLREDQDLAIALRISDAGSGEPVSRAKLAAWVTTRSEGTTTDERAAFQEIQSLVNRSLFMQARIDLTRYHVLTLNHDSVAVIDPLFGYGSTKLLELLPMGGIAFDWCLSADERRLFVSVPEAGRVVAVDTRSWAPLPESPRTDLPPERLAIQPDGRYLWIAEGEDPAGAIASGVSVVDAETLRIERRIPIGSGPHHIAFSNRLAFIASGGQGTMTVVETATLDRVADLPIAPGPSAIAYSEKAGRAYTTHPGQGLLVAVDGRAASVASRTAVVRGTSRIDFAPGGRHAFLTSPSEKTVEVLDAASGRVVKRAQLDEEPERVACSGQFAYVRYREGSRLTLIPLGELGSQGESLTRNDLPFGRSPVRKLAAHTPASPIASVPGADAVLIAHPADQSIHFYQEGMNAPTDECRNYGGQPRAVLVVDRSLSERERPGLYETSIRLPEAGSYNLLLYLDAPRLAHAFPLEIATDPALAAAREARRLAVEWRLPGPEIPVGRPSSVGLRLVRPPGSPHEAPAEVTMAVFLSPGTWSRRYVAAHRGDGIYSFEFVPPREGVYYIALRDPAPPDGTPEPTRLLRASRQPLWGPPAEGASAEGPGGSRSEEGRRAPPTPVAR